MSLDRDIELARAEVNQARRKLLRLLTAKVVQRDGTLCSYCGEITLLTQRGHSLRRTLDHVIPQKFGGSDDLENLVLACSSCNSRKGSQVSRSQLCPSCRGRTLETPAVYEVTR